MAPLSPEDLALVFRAATAAKVNPSKLRPDNPWSYQSPSAVALQAAVSELDPAAAERLQADAGVSLSLGAEAALAGLTSWSPELEQELATKRPETYKRLQSEALEAAAEQAFGAWNQREAEALEIAGQFGYNVAALMEKGHHLAARLAAQHLEQQEQQQEAERRNAWAYLRSPGR